MPSETSRVRKLVLPYLVGYGVDLGYGGDSISHTAINIDLHKPYTRVGEDPQHLAGDCMVLHWFADGVLDYVYSSHLLEDFDDLDRALTEWLRVIKPEGTLALCLPEEQRYRAYCMVRGEDRNMHHSHDILTKDVIIDILGERVSVVIAEDVEPYSFCIVMRKEDV
jgi:ubiquinone/menaquinone biosynthesis C-methylase UbiE